MESRLLALAGAASAPVLRLVVARPWLSGTTALGIGTAALFALFLIGRWDDVEASGPRSGVTFINGSAHPGAAQAATGGAELEAPEAAAPAAMAEQGSGLEALSVSSAWTGPDDAPESTAGPTTTDEPIIERTAARMSAVTQAPRGAWLTGAIEEVVEDPQHAGRWTDRSLFYPAHSRH